MNSTRVSIIIPCYQQGKYLEGAIQAALGQTYGAVEVVVVNDGSTDETDEVCKRYEGKIVYVNQKNRGLSGARNAGVKASTGEWLQFLDADDLIHRNKIEWQLRDLEAHGAKIGYCCTVYFSNGPFTEPNHCQYVGQVGDMAMALATLSLGTPIPVHTILMRRELFDAQGGFSERVKMDEDRRFFFSIAMKGEKFHFTPVVGAYYRMHSTSMTGNRLKIAESNSQFLTEVWQLANDGKVDAVAVKPVLRDSLLHLGKFCASSDVPWKDAKKFYELCYEIAGPSGKWISLRRFLPEAALRSLWVSRQRWHYLGAGKNGK